MKRVLSVFLSIIVIVIFTGCGGANISSSKVQKLVIGVMPDTDSIPFIIAEKNGYFKEEGINVEIQHFKSAAERDSALQSGKLDGVISDVLAATFAKDGGFDIKITSRTDGDYKLLVGKNTGINSIEGIKGKNIAISTNTLIEYATDKMLSAANINEKDIHKIAIPQIPTRLEMLQNGKVDAATLPDPLATLAVASGAKLIDSTGSLKINPGVILFTVKSIKNKTTEISALYKAYDKAVNYLNTEPKEKYMDYIVKEAGFPEEIKDIIVLPTYSRAEMPKEKDVEDVVSWLKQKNLIKGDYNFQNLVDDEFMR